MVGDEVLRLVDTCRQLANPVVTVGEFGQQLPAQRVSRQPDELRRSGGLTRVSHVLNYTSNRIDTSSLFDGLVLEEVGGGEPHQRLGQSARELYRDAIRTGRNWVHRTQWQLGRGEVVTAPTRYVASADFQIAYQVSGEGPIDILFNGGFFMSFEFFWEDEVYARFLGHLQSIGRLIMFDRRGVGMSDPVPASDPPTIEQWTEDALVVLDAADSQRAAVIGFGAIGGPVAMLFAATHPERTAALILINSASRWLDVVGMDADRQRMEIDRDTFVTEWPNSGGSATLEQMAPSRAGDAEFAEWHARSRRRSVSPSMAWAVNVSMRSTDVSSVLPTINVPTLVLHRRGCELLPVEGARSPAAAIPGARLVELPGSDFFLWSGDIDQILAEIQEFLTGERPEPETDRVLATVLFTDFVESTRRSIEQGDRAWRRVLDRHDQAVRRQLDRFRGRWIKQTGDGVLATFDGPARAIRCAVAIREAVRPLGIDVRTGQHSGEIELRGDDVSGIAVTIARRVCDLVEGDDVLVSRTVTDLVAGSDLEFEDRGEHELKGVPGRWELFMVKS